jgi:hypothetical protein
MAAVCCVVACPGCSSRGPTLTPSDGAGRFAPVGLSIHPISHVQLREDGTARVEAAIELVDADGFSVRGTGTLTLEFHQGGRHGEAIMSRHQWSRNLNDPTINARQFDSMTRTYLVPLELAADSMPRSPHLTATLYRAGGEPLRDSMSLAVLRPADPDPAPEETPPTP